MIKYVFFGSSQFSIHVLNEFKKDNFLPSLIVTTPDKPRGRNLIISPNIVKVWAKENKIPIFDPAKLDENFSKTLKDYANNNAIELFIVASYGKIIPESVLNIPPHFALNIHPSLLPLLRGASPIQSAMLNDRKNTGVTIIQMDRDMDHGPIVVQREYTVKEWPIYEELERDLAQMGAKMIIDILPTWLKDHRSKEQDHHLATFTKKIEKDDALLDLGANPYENFRKIQAYHFWPGAYFIHPYKGKGYRVKITKANFVDNKLVIEKVIREGGKEISYADFKRAYMYV